VVGEERARVLVGPLETIEDDQQAAAARRHLGEDGRSDSGASADRARTWTCLRSESERSESDVWSESNVPDPRFSRFSRFIW